MGGDPYQLAAKSERVGPEVPDPYEERALLTPAMTAGYDAVPEEERERLLSYLQAVVAARRAPVHTAVAFNAVYFGYDLCGEGYGASPLRPEDFPVITLGGSVPVLPVGAMVCVTTGSDPLFAEIVYREGAHPEAAAHGDVPAWVSGAPAGAEGPGEPGEGAAPRRRELLVPDLDAFGPALRLSPAQIHRLRTRQGWINADGHLVVDVCYPSHEAARRNELTAYADHLLSTARDQLLSPLVPVSLAELVGGTRDEDLRAGLAGLFDTIRGVLVSSELLRTWGQYAMTRTSLADCWRDTGPLGGDDLRSLVAAVEHAAVPVKRRYMHTSEHTVYTAVGPRLRAFPGAADLLTGTGYAAAVCRANVALADVVQRESERGLFVSGSRITLDDAFESGGVWRSHHPGASEPLEDPFIPARRGWASALPSNVEHQAEPDVDLIPVDLPLADDASLGSGELLRSDGTDVIWRAPLRLAHLINGWFSLPPAAVRDLFRSHDRYPTLRLELGHAGQTVNENEAEQDVTADLGHEAPRLTGVLWPTDFFPGLMIEVHRRLGDATIRMTTTLLRERVLIGDRETGHCYDPRVLTREDVPGSNRHGDSADGLGPRQLVMRTVRRCGLLTPDGHALMDRAALPTAAYGHRPARAQTASLESAVMELFAQRVLEPALGSRDAQGRPHHPARDGQPVIALIGYRPLERRVIRPWGGTDESGALLGVQFVPGHLRRLRPGCFPSEVQRAAFRDYCRRLGKADGWELPYGYTFVTEHTRGH
ncbi:hypothetical protein ACIPPM_19360 [Streptomyces sp. NPDC090119]|uniref:hypothetical protein n=1 Tax=Streptomyces sp. NPDC090119 TaxID=3365951 RepID=UPI003822AA4C